MALSPCLVNRKCYSPFYKLEVVKVAEEKGKHYASRFFDIDRKRVREWCKNKTKIKQQLETQEQCNADVPPVSRTPISKYSNDLKIEVIQAAEEHGKAYASQMFEIESKRITAWIKLKERIHRLKLEETQKDLEDKNIASKKFEIEQKLLSWFYECHKTGVIVTPKEVKEEALRIHEEMGSHTFKASNGWLYAFRKRNQEFFNEHHVLQMPQQPDFHATSPDTEYRQILPEDIEIIIDEDEEQNIEIQL